MLEGSGAESELVVTVECVEAVKHCAAFYSARLQPLQEPESRRWRSQRGFNIVNEDVTPPRDDRSVIMNAAQSKPNHPAPNQPAPNQWRLSPVLCATASQNAGLLLTSSPTNATFWGRARTALAAISTSFLIRCGACTNKSGKDPIAIDAK